MSHFLALIGALSLRVGERRRGPLRAYLGREKKGLRRSFLYLLGGSAVVVLVFPLAPVVRVVVLACIRVQFLLGWAIFVPQVASPEANGASQRAGRRPLHGVHLVIGGFNARLCVFGIFEPLPGGMDPPFAQLSGAGVRGDSCS